MSASEAYLEELRRALPRRHRRRVVAEIRGHLADGIAAETASGADPEEAERLTIERLGPPERIAAQFGEGSARRPTGKAAALVAAGGVAALLSVFAVTASRHPTVGATTTARPVAAPGTMVYVHSVPSGYRAGQVAILGRVLVRVVNGTAVRAVYVHAKR